MTGPRRFLGNPVGIEADGRKLLPPIAMSMQCQHRQSMCGLLQSKPLNAPPALTAYQVCLPLLPCRHRPITLLRNKLTRQTDEKRIFTYIHNNPVFFLAT